MTVKKELIVTGKTVEDARKKAAAQLGVAEAELIVTVLEEGKKGFLGIGASDAKISVSYIEEESDRLARLSSNVLTLSKLENQQIVTGQTEFYLDEQIRQCILTQESDWTAKELEIIPELEPLLYYGNEEMLALIWRNLLGNAIKFTPRGGCIRITMSVGSNDVTVSVEDNGIGMSDAVRTRIFEKFYQGDTSHAHAGYGIGLALVGRVLQLVGGTVQVESEEGKGSRFTVVLPRGRS